MKKKTVWLPMFRKVVPASYEEWMESLALEGWTADKIGRFSPIKMTFTKTESKKYRYVFDLNASPNKDYLNIYEQFGWEFVGQMASCFVWRKEYSDRRPESFSDTESIIKRNKRVKNAVTICLVMFLLGILVSIIALGVCIYVGKAEKVLELVLEIGLLAVISIYLWWVVRKINLNIER
jgi:hypothetical protein